MRSLCGLCWLAASGEQIAGYLSIIHGVETAA
jgi:hypothetical protein